MQIKYAFNAHFTHLFDKGHAICKFLKKKNIYFVFYFNYNNLVAKNAASSVNKISLQYGLVT